MTVAFHVDILHDIRFITVLVIVAARDVGFILRAGLGLAFSSFAQSAGAIDMGKTANVLFKIRAATMVGIVRALEDMTFLTTIALGAVAKGSEGTANGSSRGNIDMGISACSVGAVAAKEMCASRHTVIGRLVG